MKRNKTKWNVKKAVLLAAATSTFVLGCELIVDFDRTRIPVEGGDATTADVVQPAVDGEAPDTSTPTTDAGDAGDAGSTSSDASDAEADADAS